MNVKSRSPGEILLQLLDRSRCSVQVAACVADKRGIFAWGWNSEGPDGFGEHAERACLKRANSRRLTNATMYVMARRRNSKNFICARPCADCWPSVRQCKEVVWRDKGNTWTTEHSNSR